MPPRRAAARAAAAAAAATKRQRSSSLSDVSASDADSGSEAHLSASESESAQSDEEELSPPPKKAKAATKAAPKAKAKATPTKTKAKAEESKPEPKSKTKAKAEPETKPKATKTKAAAKPKDEPPAKKPKTAPKAKWPPAGIDPATFPPRAGWPLYVFPESERRVAGEGNGGLSPSTAFERPLMVGAHTSIAGGPAGALLRCRALGANGAALFMKGARQWRAKPFEDDVVERWAETVKEGEKGSGYGPEAILVHGNYLINLGNPDPAKWENAYECFQDDIERCHRLGIKLYNWHPGSTVGACDKETSFALVAKAINRVHKAVPEVITVIENMANAGSNILGTRFEDLAAMIELVEDKTRVRVCIDTCHVFAAGYDIRSPETYKETMSEFHRVVGNKYLGGVHLNDSKMALGGFKDLHENIGLGHIGLSGFRALMRDPLMAGIPLILETPMGAEGDLTIWRKEVALLYEIQRIEDAEWAEQRDGIEKRWRAERDAIHPPKEKAVKGKAAKGKKGKKEESDEDD